LIVVVDVIAVRRTKRKGRRILIRRPCSVHLKVDTDRVRFVEQGVSAQVEARRDDPERDRQQKGPQPELGGDDRADGGVAFLLRLPGPQTSQAEAAFIQQENLQAPCHDFSLDRTFKLSPFDICR
jgi:hypothetical protein